MPHAYYVYGPWPALILGVLFWGSIVALIVWVVHRLTRGGGREDSTPPRRTPMDYLKERYAKGEITREQFEEMRRDVLDEPRQGSTGSADPR